MIVVVSADFELPAQLADRVRRYRARLGPHAKRVGPGEVIMPDANTEAVLAVGALPHDQGELVAWLKAARAALSGRATIRILDSTRPPRSGNRRVPNLVGRRSVLGRTERDVPKAVRAAGWTIASVERIDVEGDAGLPEMWVDLLAMDVSATTVPPGVLIEGDGADQRSE